MRFGRSIATAVVAASTFLGACGGAFKQPEVTVTGARLGGVGLRGGLVYFDVAVRNPNRYTLKADRFSYDMRVQDPSNANNWLPLTVGTYDQEIRIGGHETTNIEVPLQFDYNTSQAAVRSIMDRGTLNYRVTGNVNVTEPISRNVPFTHQGIVTMAGAR